MTWNGGNIAEGDAAALQFVGGTDSAQDYTFNVRQTYSDGSVVDWNGASDSDNPAPVVEAKSSLTGGGGDLDRDLDRPRPRRGRARPRHRRARRPRREPRAGMKRVALIAAVAGAALALPAAAWAHAVLLKTVPVASKVLNARSDRGRAHLQRADRAALRDRLGHRRERKPGHRTARPRARPATRTPSSSRSKRSPRAGTSSTGA